MAPPKIFVSYSHADTRWKDELQKHLKVLELEGLLETWHDRKIQPGEEFLEEIRSALTEAAVAILLISSDFLTSDFIRNEEIPALLDRRSRGGLQIIPLIVRPCPWKGVSWLARIQCWPRDGKEISALRKPKREEQLKNLAIEVSNIVKPEPATLPSTLAKVRAPGSFSKSASTPIHLGDSSNQPPAFQDLGEEDFEELCCALLDAREGVASCTRLDRRQQAESEVDLVAELEDGSGVIAGRCHCLPVAAPADIREAVDDFLRAFLPGKPWRELILFVAGEVNGCRREINRQVKRLEESQIVFQVWAGSALAQRLAPHPAIVRRFFDPPEDWISRLCGRAMPGFQPQNVLVQINPTSQILGTALATQIAERVEDLAKRGQIAKALQEVTRQRKATTWAALEPKDKERLLYLEGSICLQLPDRLPRVREIAEHLGNTREAHILQARILHHEGRIQEALDFLDREGLEAPALRAALLIGQSNFEEALLCLGAAREDEDVSRLRAVAHLCRGDVEAALEAAIKAHELAPENWATREVLAICLYFGALSPAAAPPQPIAWPQPVNWWLVRRDEASLSNLRKAEDRFRTLERQPGLSRETRQEIQTWLLACLANDSERQELAAEYCRDLISQNKAHAQAVIWAAARNYDVPFQPVRKALRVLLDQGKAGVTHVLGLLACILGESQGREGEVRGRALSKGLKLLDETQEIFSAEKAPDLWQLWRVQLNPRSELTELPQEICESEAGRHEYFLRVTALEPTADISSLLETFAAEMLQDDDLDTCFKSCLAMAARNHWGWIASHAEVLVRRIATADACDLAAKACYLSGEGKRCLELLEDHAELFPGKRLPWELQRLRVATLRDLGLYSDAIDAQKRVVAQVPSLQNQVDLWNLHRSRGDSIGAVLVARDLERRTDLTSSITLPLSMDVRSEDPELAKRLLRRSVAQGLDDLHVPAAVEMASRLGLQEELDRLWKRLNEVAISGHETIRIASQEEVLQHIRQQQQKADELSAKYCEGLLPVHGYAGALDLNLAHYYHQQLLANEEGGSLVQQPIVFIRHGARVTLTEFPTKASEWRLHLDLTAILLASHLDVLDIVANCFRPLFLPQGLMPLLQRMAADDAFHQAPELREWLKSLNQKLLDEDTYRVLPKARIPNNERLPEDTYLFPIRELAGHESPEGGLCWIDDRYFSAFLKIGCLPGVGTVDVLAGLKHYGFLDSARHFACLQKLRAGNARYLPTTAEEILHFLRMAPIQGHQVVETEDLAILRRYYAACFAQEDLLQRPPVPDGFPAQDGEVWFLAAMQRAVSEALVGLWETPSGTNETDEIRANWIWESLEISQCQSLPGWVKSSGDQIKVFSIILAGIIGRSFSLNSRGFDEEGRSPRSRFLAWIEHRVLRPLLPGNSWVWKELAGRLREMVFQSTEADLKTADHWKVQRALLSHFAHDLPEALQEELVNEPEIREKLELLTGPFIGVENECFERREFLKAVEVTIHEGRAEVSNVIGKPAQLTRQSSPSEQPSILVHIDHKQFVVTDPLFNFLLLDTDLWTSTLRTNRHWLDQPSESFEATVGQLVQTQDPLERLWRVESLRYESTAYYYRELSSRLSRQTITIETLRPLEPPSAASLLRFLRVQELEDEHFVLVWKSAWESLILDEGISEAFQRLSGLPIPLPTIFFEALEALPPEELGSLLTSWLSERTSVVGRIHLLGILVALQSHWEPPESKVSSIIDEILKSGREVRAFLNLLRWSYELFGHRIDSATLPVRSRLILAWAHAHQLYHAFGSCGVGLEWITDYFRQDAAEHWLQRDLLEGTPESAHDVANPHSLQADQIIFQGVYYALSFGNPEAGRLALSVLRDWTLDTSNNTLRQDRWSLLQDNGTARNCLGAFLGSNRHNILARLGNETFDQAVSAEDFLKNAVASLEAGSAALPWVELKAILGSYPPYSSIVEGLVSGIVSTDFLSLCERSWEEGVIALRFAAQQIWSLNSPDAAEHLGKELLRVASFAAEQCPEISAGDLDQPRGRWEVRAAMLFEAAFMFSRIPGNRSETVKRFAQLAFQLCRNWNALVDLARSFLQRLVDGLPLEEARPLWPVLLQLRAVQPRRGVADEP